jgi:hypothetical protein
MSADIKVDYWARKGNQSTAYINEISGRGEDKYTEVPVILKWSVAVQRWDQIDTWEWIWSHDKFVRTTDNEGEH